MHGGLKGRLDRCAFVVSCLVGVLLVEKDKFVAEGRIGENETGENENCKIMMSRCG